MSESVQEKSSLQNWQVPEGLVLHQMSDPARRLSYFLAFKQAHSDYDGWIRLLGKPDGNAELLMRLLAGQGALVDVGANIGTIAVPVSLAGSEVVAIEIHPENCLRLWTAVLVNDLANFHIVQAGAGERDGLIEFHGNEAGANVHAGGKGTPATYLRLDTILTRFPNLQRGSTVIKLDVEGHEYAVLRGATSALSKLRPVVLFESIQTEGAELDNAVLTREYLANLGYALYLVRGKTLVPRLPRDVQEGHVCDFLAVPEERKLDLAALGYEVRSLTVNERISWVSEMLNFQKEHQRHAAGVLKRWSVEEPALKQYLKPLFEELA